MFNGSQFLPSNRQDGGNIPKIPSLPMSYADATELIKLLEGHGKELSSFGAEWEGGIREVRYFTGPSKQLVRLVNEVDTKVTPSTYQSLLCLGIGPGSFEGCLR